MASFYDYSQILKQARTKQSSTFADAVKVLTHHPFFDSDPSFNKHDDELMGEIYDEQFLLDIYKSEVKSGRGQEAFLEIAELGGDNQLFFDSACRITSHHLQKGTSTDDMTAWAVMVLMRGIQRPKAKTGKHKYSNLRRDIEIASMVSDMVTLGLTPTRNDASEASSGCDVVVHVLEKNHRAISYSAISKIWNKYKNKAHRELGATLLIRLFIHNNSEYSDIQI